MGNVLVIAQILDGVVKKSTHSTATFATQVAGYLGGNYDILALGDALDGPAETLVKLGASKVFLATGAQLDHCLSEQWVPIIEQVVKAGDYRVVVCPSSSTGKDVMPRLAARLQAGMASDVVAVSYPDNTLTYERPMYAGNVNGQVQVATERAVVTIRQTEFDSLPEGASTSPTMPVAITPPATAAQRIRFEKFEKSVTSRPDLSEAAVVVSGGRGLKSKENFKLVEDLADQLGGAVGATRAAVDAGFIHNDFQVGQTGKIVAPELYLAIGLSGALQHVAGMKSSKVIVAINKDEEAAIFQLADYGMVGDLFKIMPELSAEIKKVTQ